MQFELAGNLPLDDGRYLVRSGDAERVMVTETEGALPPARRRRRRPRKATTTDAPVTVTVTVVTVIRADQPFASETEAEDWLERLDDSDFTGELLEDTIGTLDRVRAADAGTSGIPFGTPTDLDGVLAAKVGYGDGDQVASGLFTRAVEVDARGGAGEKRRERAARSRSPARTAAILGGRKPPDACEVLVPRIRLDLDTGNDYAAILALPPAVRATISELEFAVEDENHEKDLDQLEALLPELDELAGQDGHERDGDADLELVDRALTITERVIRRRRVLDQ